MKICPKCQQIMEDSFEFCGRCGSGLDYLSPEDSEAWASAGKAADEMSLQELNEAMDKLVAEQNLQHVEDDEEPETVSEDEPEEEQVRLPMFGDGPEEDARSEGVLPVRETPPLPVREETPVPAREESPVERRRPVGHQPPSIRSLQGEDGDDPGSAAPGERRRPVGHRPPSIHRAQGEDGASDSGPAARRAPAGHRPPSVNRPPSANGAGTGAGRPAGHRPPSVNRATAARSADGTVVDNYEGLNAQSKERADDRYEPIIPPFVTAEEAARPSPFAPAKNTPSVSADDKDDKKSASVRSTYITSTSGELAASTKICPCCKTRAFSSDKNCKNCGYQFPKSGAMSVLSERNVNIVGILASIAMGASVFVNFITYTLNDSQVEFALISKIDGYAFLALAALALVLSAFGRNIGVISVGTLAVLASWVENFFIYYDVTQVKKGGHIDNEVGFYLLVAGAALILIAGIVGKVKEKKKMEKYMSYMNNSY
ncbi:MAG: hypothetical protein IK020_03470 [Clostridiales bacterium]|nr:hypothetical protein [Clostridiales bacterium]